MLRNSGLTERMLSNLPATRSATNHDLSVNKNDLIGFSCMFKAEAMSSENTCCLTFYLWTLWLHA